MKRYLAILSALRPLDSRSLARAVRRLAERDSDLARIIRRYGRPPLWGRAPGFSTLLHIILEQQVSLASARAAYDRLLMLASPLTPERFLQLDDIELKTCGFSRQKTVYGRNLAEAIARNDLDLAMLAVEEDSVVRTELMKIKGIGRWTADIYLLMVLRRPDIWPSGDRALAVAVERVKRLKRIPTQEELNSISEAWQPWRAVAARILWHFYLSAAAGR